MNNNAIEFPYQIVAFLDKEPNTGESVYGGARGWFAQVALKRRFKIVGYSESDFIDSITQYLSTTNSMRVESGGLIKPDRMPVRVIEILNKDDWIDQHVKLLEFFKNDIVSKFPEREGENYFPHITAEYSGHMVIDTDRFVNNVFTVNNMWLLKDDGNEDSKAFVKIPLKDNKQ